MGLEAKDLEELAQKDYNEARNNILQAQKLLGENKDSIRLIDEVRKKLDEFHESWIKYLSSEKKLENLIIPLNIAIEAKFLSNDVLGKAIENNPDLKEMKKNAITDSKIARDNLYKAEEMPGKFVDRDKLIKVVNEKLDAYNESWQKYQYTKDQNSLKESMNIALEAKLLSQDIIERARKCDPEKGILYIEILVIIVAMTLFFYWYLHWLWDVRWFEGDLWYEIVFFSVFGALTNLTYSAALHVIWRDFDLNHKGWYLSKIPQAPLIALGILLLLRSISIEALGVPIDLRTAPNEVMLAFAYFLGLFSRRTWMFMEKIGKYLIPVSESEMKT